MFQYFILTQYNFKYLSIMKLIVLMLDKGKSTQDMFRRRRSVLPKWQKVAITQSDFSPIKNKLKIPLNPKILQPLKHMPLNLQEAVKLPMPLLFSLQFRLS